MSIFDKLTNLFHQHKDKLPNDIGSVDEIKAKAAEMLDQHADTIDQITAKIPGEADDQFVDKAREVTGPKAN